jgi:CheY-like chemotaxis protein
LKQLRRQRRAGILFTGKWRLLPRRRAGGASSLRRGGRIQSIEEAISDDQMTVWASKCFNLPDGNSLARQNDQKTVLLATDDPAVLNFVGKSLVQNNYNVLIGHSGEEALKQMTTYKHEIHLLLSALDMPGVNGLGLAAQVSVKWPDLKVLLMSECRGGTLVLNEGWHFLPKPFVTSQLNALILTLLSPPGMVPKYKRLGFPASKKAAA